MNSIKEIWTLYVSDIKNDGFLPKDILKYGLPMTLALIAACVLVEFLNNL